MKKFMSMLTAIFIFLIYVNIYAAEVGPDGSFNHSIDITLPPGTAGLTPKLSLSYNSNSGNGIVGQGWSLEGLPFIMRDPSRGIKYDATDTYTGYSGTLIKQTDGTYHFQYENYSKIEVHGSAANPDYWIETRSDGTKYYYGAYDDSANAESANVKALDGKGRQVDSKVRVWALSKVLDTHGNFYTVEYKTDSGEFYPVRIIYTQRGNINFRLRVIDFEYDDSRKDFFTQYIYSSSVTTKLRLKSITVKVNVPQFFNYPIIILGKTVREYTLVYNKESELINSMLKRIEVNDSSSINIEKISFNWSDSSGSIDFSPQSNFNLTNEQIISKRIEGDFNGDGRTDFIRLKNLIQKNALFISNGNGTFLKAGSFNLEDIYLASDDSDLTSGDETCGTLTGDYNGDGKTDLLRWQYNPLNNKLYFSNGDGSFTESGNFNIPSLFFNNGFS